MARIRSIKPEFAGDEKMAKVSRDARLTFLLVVSQADDAGLLAAAPRQILGTLYPLDESVTIELLEAWLAELLAIGRIRWRLTRDGARVIEVINWLKHQRIDKVTPSKITPLLIKLAESSRGSREEAASGQPIEAEVGSGVGSRKLEAEKEVGVKGRGDIDISTSRVENSNDPPSGEGTSNSNNDRHVTAAATTIVRKFIRKFYDEPGKRRVDVVGQLEALLTTRGVKLDKSTQVWAVDRDHLDDACRAVIEKPPDNPDKAIVFVLKKLRDSRLEVMSRRNKTDSSRRVAPPDGGSPARIGGVIAKEVA